MVNVRDVLVQRKESKRKGKTICLVAIVGLCVAIPLIHNYLKEDTYFLYNRNGIAEITEQERSYILRTGDVSKISGGEYVK